MSSISFYIFFIFFLAFLLLAINLLFAPSNPYQEKDSAFECGFHSFLGQNRTQFSISFFVFALLFLLFDLEILLVYPYVVSAYSNEIYGLVIMLIFFLVLTLGFAFELGKKALNIDTRQSSPASTSNTNLNVKFTFKNLLASTNRKNFSTTNNKNSFMVTLINLITSFLSAFVPLVLPLYWLFIFYFFDLAKVVNIFNLDFTKTSIYILTYLFYLIVVWLIVLFWDFFISKVLLSKKMVCHLPARFAKYLACKNKSMKIVRCIFTVKYFFTYLLGFSIISIPYLVHYFYTGDFLVFLPADVWPLYILYVSFAFNIARCYIYNIRFISRENLCFFFYSFILLVLTKLTVYFLITLVFISIEQNNKSAKVIDKGDFYFSDTLNKYQEYIDRIVIFSKAFIKAMCNLPYLRILGLNNLLDPKLTSSGPNWHLIKFKYHDLPFNSSKFLSKNPSIPHFDLGLKLRHSSTILNAVSSLEIKCSRLAFTYRGPYIDIYRLSSISCQNLNLDFLHIENIGSFQKSSFSFNVETLRENSNLLLSKTSWKNIENSSVLNNISSIKDKNNLLDCFNLNKDKYGKDPNMDISHLRNPMVYMYKRANDNESIDVSESYEAHSEKSDEKANLEKDLSLVQKLKNQLSHSTKSPEELEAIKSEYEVFFDEESGNNSLEGLEELEEYLNGELSSINKKLNSIEKAKPNYIDALKKKRRL